MKNLLFLDCETTGITSKNGIIQIAGYVDRVLDFQNIEPLEKFNLTCNIYEDEIIAEEALKKNGITKTEIASYKHPSLAFNEFDKIMRKYHRFGNNFILLAYNARFDYGFMERWYDKGSPLNGKGNPDKRFFHLIGAEVIDVAGLVVDLFLWNNIKLKNFKLETLAPYFKIEHKAHDAYSDIEVTREIFYRIKRYQIEKLPYESLFQPFEFKKEELANIELD